MGDSTICTSSVLRCLLGFQGRGGLPVTTSSPHDACTSSAQQTVIAHDGAIDRILALRRSTTPGGGRSSTGGTVVKHGVMALGSSPYRVHTLKLGLQPLVLAAKLGDLLRVSGRPNIGSERENTTRRLSDLDNPQRTDCACWSKTFFLSLVRLACIRLRSRLQNTRQESHRPDCQAGARKR